MTLNITVVTPRYVCQVSDQRLRRIKRYKKTGKLISELYTDRANKATLLECKDARVLITFHGFAECSGTRTDHWLLETLGKSRPEENQMEKILHKLAGQASAWFDSFCRRPVRDPIKDFSHSFVIAGLTNAGLPIMFWVSNYERFGERFRKERSTRSWSRFEISGGLLKINRPTPVYVYAGGAYEAVLEEDIKLLEKAAKLSGAKPKDVVNIAVRCVQNAATSSHPDSYLIGKNCVAALVQPDKPVEGYSFSSSGAKTLQSPNYVHVPQAPGLKGHLLFKDFEVYEGKGVPPWRVRDAMQAHRLTSGQIRKEMRNLPTGYRTGDPLQATVDPAVAKFLEALPSGIGEQEILDAL